MIEAMNQKIFLLDDEARWQAVERRDPAADGAFVYGVRSTGVYCRPTCPSRRPRRSQVIFFDGPTAAEGAGFRACRRCRPQDDLRPAAELVERARRLIDSAEAPPTLADLSAALAVSPFHLQRTFKAVTGLTPRQYAAALRAGRLKKELRPAGGSSAAQSTVAGAGYEAGYGSSSQLYAAAASALGMSPGAYRKGGMNMEIRYTTVETPLGCLMLAATGRGICAAQFGESSAALLDALRHEFPRAQITCDEAGLAAWAEALRASLEGGADASGLPLDVQGTAFQQRVWAELRAIPRGQTRTYTQVAGAIGQPGAARAVARACATNPAALVIPCHRVVRAGGALAGYRWGVERKQALLEKEAA